MLYNKALCVYHCLFKIFSNVENVPNKVFVKLFSSMVIPVLLYGCVIWGPYLPGKITSFETFKTKIFKITNQIEKFHLKFCKNILGVHSKSTNVAVYFNFHCFVKYSSLVRQYCNPVLDSDNKTKSTA